MSDQPQPHTPRAVVHSQLDRRRRLSLIWAIPIVSALIGGWLAWRTLAERGPLITITFESASGLTAGQSHVRHKDVDMGLVEKIALSKDLQRVVVTVRMNREAGPLLTDKAQFWIVKPRFFAGAVSGLETLVSGSYIELQPSAAGGEPTYHFTGLETPPVLTSDVPGHTFLLTAPRLGSITLGSPVFFRDLDVGEVLGWDLGNMAETVTIHAFVRAPFDKYVHDNSRFWNASGAKVALGPNGLELQVESLRAVLLGGIAFDTPNQGSGFAVSPENHVFPLYDSEEAADSAAFTRRLQFLAYFQGSVAGLASGAAVTLHGIKIGEVGSVGLQYDKSIDAVVAPVHFAVEPDRIAELNLPTGGDQDATIADLVHRGLRVKLDSASLLTGQKQLAMDIYRDTPPAVLSKQGDTYIIPVLPGGSEDIATAAGALLGKLEFDTVPADRRQPEQDIGRPERDGERAGSAAVDRIAARHAGGCGQIGAAPEQRQRAAGPEAAGDHRGAGHHRQAAERAGCVGAVGLWRQFGFQPRRQSVAGAAHRYGAVVPCAGGSADAPPRGADPRPHRARISMMRVRR